MIIDPKKVEQSDIDLMQSYALVENTANNTNMKYSKIPKKNKALNTTNKDVVHAINEVKSSVDNIQKNVTVTLDKQNSVIGDISANPELRQKFADTGYKTVVDAVVGLKDSMETNKGLTTRQVVFVVPTLTKQTALPEIYFPESGVITKITATVSSTDNSNRNDVDADINITLQHSNKGSITWEDIATTDIAQGSTYAEYTVTDADIENKTTEINGEILRLKIDKMPSKTAGLSVVVTVSI